MVFVFDLFDLKIKTLFWEINFQHNQRLDGNFKHFIRIRPESFCPSIWMVHGIGYVGLLNRNSPVHMYLVSHPHSDSPSNKEQRTTIIIIIVMDHQTRDDGEAFLESRHAKLYSNYYGSHRHKEEGRWVDRDEIVFVFPFPTGIAINNLWSLLPAPCPRCPRVVGSAGTHSTKPALHHFFLYRVCCKHNTTMGGLVATNGVTGPRDRYWSEVGQDSFKEAHQTVTVSPIPRQIGKEIVVRRFRIGSDRDWLIDWLSPDEVTNRRREGV